MGRCKPLKTLVSCAGRSRWMFRRNEMCECDRDTPGHDDRGENPPPTTAYPDAHGATPRHGAAGTSRVGAAGITADPSPITACPAAYGNTRSSPISPPCRYDNESGAWHTTSRRPAANRGQHGISVSLCLLWLLFLNAATTRNHLKRQLRKQQHQQTFKPPSSPASRQSRPPYTPVPQAPRRYAPQPPASGCAPTMACG
jgi:hypothetical protein